MFHLLLAIAAALTPTTDADLAHLDARGAFEPVPVMLLAGLTDEADKNGGDSEIEPTDCCIMGASCCKRIRDGHTTSNDDGPGSPGGNVTNDDGWWLAHSTGAPGSPSLVTAAACTA